MSNRVYPGVVEVSGGMVQFGDNFITNLGTTVQLNNEVVDIEQLINNLKQTTKQCEDLRNCLLARPEPVSLAQSLSDDIEDLRARIDTLRFHLEDNDLSASQGWQRSLIELEEMTCSYQKLLRQTQKIVEQPNSSREQDAIHATGMRYDIKRLRLKLDIAIGVVSFCIYQRADPESQMQEVKAMHERLRAVLEHIENEKALTLGPTKPLTASRINDVQDGGSELMQRFVARSIDSDQATLREASMRVSTFMENFPLIAENEAAQPDSSKGKKTFNPIRPRFLGNKQSKSRDRPKILRDFSRLRFKFYRVPDPASVTSLEKPSTNVSTDNDEGYYSLPGGGISRMAALTGSAEIGSTSVTLDKPAVEPATSYNMPAEIYTISGVASGQSEQLQFFKDYYSHDDIHPGDKVSVLWAYQPRAMDEFELDRGDMLHVVGIWDDGWATGVFITDRAEDYERSHRAEKQYHSETPVRKSTSPPSSGEIKAFPLVCVCLPEVWKETISGDSSNTDSRSPSTKVNQDVGLAF